jgi:hypothetical protein
MICEHCGVDVQIGMWAFCPHEKGANTVVGDDWPGGKTFENGWPEPRTFYSNSEHQRALAAAGLQNRIDNRGPDDKICPRWDTVDLDAARTLLERGPQAIRARRNPYEGADMPISVRILESGVKRSDLP